MIKKYSIDYPCFSGEEKRNLYIYLPKNYESSQERYPVLYMFDGHNVFYDKDATYGRSWRLGKYLDKNKIELIVVALECNSSTEGGRMLEYCPFPLSDPRKSNVIYQTYGDDTFKWFIEVLKPRIDDEYRTLTDRNNTFIAGSSMGGLMATYGLLKYSNYFSKAASLSPAYFTCLKDVKEFVKNVEVSDAIELYTDYGTDDLFPKKSIPAFITINKILVQKGVCVTSRIIEGGKHCEECWEKQLPFMFNTLLYDKEIVR